MVIIESKNYIRDYKKIIINKHLTQEMNRIENIKNIILSSKNLQEYTARINGKLRLFMKPVGEYPYDNIVIDKIEFIKLNDKHYGEG